MPNLLKLYVDTQRNRLVQSDTDGSPFTLPRFTLGDVVPVQVMLLEDDSDNGLNSPFVTTTFEYTVKIAICDPAQSGETVYTSATLTWDGVNYIYEGTLILNNTGSPSIDSLVTANDPATATFELEISGSGIYHTAVQETITVKSDGIKTGTPMTPPVTGYYTDAQCDSTFVAKAGGTMTGELVLNAGLDMATTSRLITKRLDDTAITGVGNYTLGSYNATLIRLDALIGNATIVGIDGGEDGRHLIVYNPNSSYSPVFADQSVSEAVAANRIKTTTGSDVTLSGEGAAHFVYDAKDSRWVMVAVNA